MKLGVALPFIDVAVGGDPAAIREFAQTAEEIGILRSHSVAALSSDRYPRVN